MGIAIAIFLLSYSVLNFTQSALLGVVALLVALWTNEGLPMGVVSLLPIILFPSLGILETQATAINYSNPIIYLFFGGFLLAIAVEKSDLHAWIADKMLGLFPNTPRGMI
ncbi:MAG: SLC13 family permease, partial [Sulfurimonas sp.]